MSKSPVSTPPEHNCAGWDSCPNPAHRPEQSAPTGPEGYFIAPDAWNDLWVWRERGNYPVPVLAQNALRDDPEVWDALAATIPTVQA